MRLCNGNRLFDLDFIYWKLCMSFHTVFVRITESFRYGVTTRHHLNNIFDFTTQIQEIVGFVPISIIAVCDFSLSNGECVPMGIQSKFIKSMRFYG